MAEKNQSYQSFQATLLFCYPNTICEPPQCEQNKITFGIYFFVFLNYYCYYYFPFSFTGQSR